MTYETRKPKHKSPHKTATGSKKRTPQGLPGVGSGYAFCAVDKKQPCTRTYLLCQRARMHSHPAASWWGSWWADAQEAAGHPLPMPHSHQGGNHIQLRQDLTSGQKFQA